MVWRISCIYCWECQIIQCIRCFLSNDLFSNVHTCSKFDQHCLAKAWVLQILSPIPILLVRYGPGNTPIDSIMRFTPQEATGKKSIKMAGADLWQHSKCDGPWIWDSRWVMIRPAGYCKKKSALKNHSLSQNQVKEKILRKEWCVWWVFSWWEEEGSVVLIRVLGPYQVKKCWKDFSVLLSEYPTCQG